ncbi:MAG: FAD-dependent oxidoreductase [Casimicrobiaceae bacterium]
MTIHAVTLLSRDDVAAGTMAFHFSKPPGFMYKPGQAIDVLIGKPEAALNDDNRHTFSLVGAPGERDLTVATRMRDSAFKRALKALAPGAPLRIEGPSGSLLLHRDSARAAVMIAGGIGITPFVSMLRNAAAERTPRPLTLVYSNRAPKDAAFFDELALLEGSLPGFRLVSTMTEASGSVPPWAGETRLVGVALLRSATEGLAAPVFYIAGPPAMVEAVRAMLADMDISDDDIRSEDFYGY